MPGTRAVDLTQSPKGQALRPGLTKTYEYSDCWVEDARLTLLNVVDARRRGAVIYPRTKVSSVRRCTDHWEIDLVEDDKTAVTVSSKMIVNAGGPWVTDIVKNIAGLNTADRIRL